jgi:flagellar motor switch protein FliN/FliY
MEVKKVQFPELEEGEKGAKLGGKALGDIPVQVNVELGKTKLSLKEVLELAEGSIIELDRLAGEPLDLIVGGQLIAQGEVVAIDDYYGLRITNVLLK